MSRTLKNFLLTLAGAAPGALLCALALMVAFSMTEGVGFLLLLPTLEAAGLDLRHQGSAGHYARLIDQALAVMGIPATLLVLLSIFVALVGVRALLGAAQTVAAANVMRRLEIALRERLYRAIGAARWLFVCRNRSSEFVHALTGEVDRVTSGTYAMLYLAADLIVSAVYLAVALMLSVPMTLVVLGAGALLALMMRERTRMIDRAGAAVSAGGAGLYAAAIEHMQGLKAARTYGAQERNFKRFSDLTRRLARSHLETVRLEASAAAWIDLGTAGVLGVVVYLAVKALAVPAAALLVLLALFVRLMPLLKGCHGWYRQAAAALPSYANIAALKARCESEAEAPADAPHAMPAPAMARAAALEGVTFSYPSGGTPAVRDADLVIPAGRITAIAGPSGAGKSTIADLLMGLLQPDAGRVTVDGKALDGETLGVWRNQIGYVSSDTFLFNDTVRANLLWARPGAGDGELAAALKMAAADEFVNALPGGLDTVVGDRGAMLSEGERQRLALARALLRRPALLVLDEATNGLDLSHESRVLGAIEELRGRVTVVIIAHRLTAIRCADLIYVVAKGEVVESGNFTALAAEGSSRLRALFEAGAGL